MFLNQFQLIMNVLIFRFLLPVDKVEFFALKIVLRITMYHGEKPKNKATLGFDFFSSLNDNVYRFYHQYYSLTSIKKNYIIVKK